MAHTFAPVLKVDAYGGAPHYYRKTVRIVTRTVRRKTITRTGAGEQYVDRLQCERIRSKQAPGPTHLTPAVCTVPTKRCIKRNPIL